jgi:hypothetical protein
MEVAAQAGSPDEAQTAAVAPSERRWDSWVLGAAALLSVAVLAVYFGSEFVPTHDGPNQLVSAWLTNHLDDPGRNFRVFLHANVAATSTGFEALFSALEWLLPWRTALRVLLAAGSLGWAWGFLYTAHAIPGRLALGLLGFAAALPWCLYMGFYSFFLATAVAWWAIGFVLHRWPATRFDRFAAGTMIAVIAYMHSFPAMLVIAFVLLAALLRSPREAVVAELARSGVACLPGTVLVAVPLLRVVPEHEAALPDSALGEEHLSVAQIRRSSSRRRAWSEDRCGTARRSRSSPS